MRVEREVVLPVSVVEAWELLTDPEEIGTWLGTAPGWALLPGARTKLHESDGTVRTLVVEEVVEGQSVALTWWADGDGPETATRVSFVVEEAAGGSRVVVTEEVRARASVAGGVRRLAIGAGWDGRLCDLELRALLRDPVLV